MYKDGAVAKLSYKEKGNWIIAHLTDSAINKKKYPLQSVESFCVMIVSFDRMKAELDSISLENPSLGKLEIGEWR